jgi:hypothetical protein
MSYVPPTSADNADPDDELLLWLLLVGAPASGGGCCAGVIAILLCSGIGFGVVWQFLQDHLQRLLHLFP